MTFRDFILVVVLLALAAVAVVVLAPPLAEVRRLRQEIAELQEKQKEQDERFVLMRQEMDALQRGEPRAIERVAREKFGYCRPGEEIIHMD
ncbi:MAG: FtsB family cell division protein [Lentisphaeria bacterium]|jgi:cell division protein FtsB